MAYSSEKWQGCEVTRLPIFNHTSSAGCAQGEDMTDKPIVDIMIDIETLSTKANGAIWEIGIAHFVPGKPETVEEICNIQFDLLDVIMCGGEVDQDTIAFWRSQPKPSLKEHLSVENGLLQMNRVLSLYSVGNYWANSPSFDLVMLETMCERAGTTYPWDHRSHMDMRTIRKWNRMYGLPENPMPQTAHCGSKDAFDQAVWVTETQRDMRMLVDMAELGRNGDS
jgi:hypothetical protein